jgi:hypothetical protein
MPNFHLSNDSKNIYSIDMMLAYINIYGHPVVRLNVDEFIPQLKQSVWGDWSPMDVINNINKTKYESNTKRIQEADLRYPVIITKKHVIVDGYHRIAKAYLNNKKYIDVYIFNSELMNKFIISKDLDYVKVQQNTDINEMIELWVKRFCK